MLNKGNYKKSLLFSIYKHLYDMVKESFITPISYFYINNVSLIHFILHLILIRYVLCNI